MWCAVHEGLRLHAAGNAGYVTKLSLGLWPIDVLEGVDNLASLNILDDVETCMIFALTEHDGSQIGFDRCVDGPLESWPVVLLVIFHRHEVVHAAMQRDEQVLLVRRLGIRYASWNRDITPTLKCLVHQVGVGNDIHA